MSHDDSASSQDRSADSAGTDTPAHATVLVNAATTTSSTASHQHQQEQEMLSSFNVPNPPAATKQSGAADTDKSHNDDNPRTLWMGDLDPWLDEQGIENLWWQVLNKKVVVKVIRPKIIKPDLNLNGLAHSGYCFVEFETFEDAKQALSLNGQLLPDIAMPSQAQFPNNPDNQKKYFRLNWASGATLSAPIVQSPEFSLFVGDLSASTTEAHLLAFFQKSFPTSVKTVRVMTDPVSGKSRCFGFVRFTDESERQRALAEMNGVWFGGRPLRVALATPRNSGRGRFNNQVFYNDQLKQPEMMYFPPPFGFYGNSMMPMGLSSPENPNVDLSQEYDSEKAASPQVQGQPYTDPTNTTVFVGGLSSEVAEQTLFTLFKPFGIIQQVKIPPGKNCGFVKYSTREEAEEAIAAMQGFIIGGDRVRLSWGRVSVNNKKYQQQQQQVAQVAQIQAAAAMSMGLDPASAIAAAGGYPPRGMAGSGGPPPGMGVPPLAGAGAPPGGPNYGIPPMRPQASSSDTSYQDQDTSFDNASGKPAEENYGVMPPYYMGMPPNGQVLDYGQNNLINSMNSMSLNEAQEGDDVVNRYMIPPMYGGYAMQQPYYYGVGPENISEEAADKQSE